jgi:hypothetical protein
VYSWEGCPMFNSFRKKARLAGLVGITTFIGAGAAVADGPWTITVQNNSKVPADISIFCESKQVGTKATGVSPGGTAKISIPATGPSYKDKYSWKAEYQGKSCGAKAVPISGSTTIPVTCDAAPPPPPPKADKGGTQTKDGPLHDGDISQAQIRNESKYEMSVDWRDLNVNGSFTTKVLQPGEQIDINVSIKHGQFLVAVVGVPKNGTVCINEPNIDLRRSLYIGLHAEKITNDAYKCYAQWQHANL